MEGVFSLSEHFCMMVSFYKGKALLALPLKEYIDPNHICYATGIPNYSHSEKK